MSNATQDNRPVRPVQLRDMRDYESGERWYEARSLTWNGATAKLLGIVASTNDALLRQGRGEGRPIVSHFYIAVCNPMGVVDVKFCVDTAELSALYETRFFCAYTVLQQMIDNYRAGLSAQACGRTVIGNFNRRLQLPKRCFDSNREIVEYVGALLFSSSRLNISKEAEEEAIVRAFLAVLETSLRGTAAKRRFVQELTTS